LKSKITEHVCFSHNSGLVLKYKVSMFLYEIVALIFRKDINR
jgi:hypothetical protein